MYTLRKLQGKDAEGMLEWMHDVDVVKDLQGNFLNKEISDCENFIAESHKDLSNLHLAIVDEYDEYLGTVSLKNIEVEHARAEFAIAIRRRAMGTGCASFAIAEIVRIGLEEMGLKEIYWYVSCNNLRAIRFYEKMCCAEMRADEVEALGCETNAKYKWYMVRGRLK